MRITSNSITGNYLRNLSRNLEQVQKTQNQLSSGKEVSKPSDNPMLVSKIMNLDSTISENEQYKETIGAAMDWVNTSDGALGNVTDTLQRVRELVVSGATGTLSDTERSAIADEIRELSNQVSDSLNTKFDGRYIFAGQKTTEPPFSVGADGVMTYSGDAGNISREIAPNVGLTIMSSGAELTTAETSDPQNKSLGDLLNNIVNALESGDTAALSGKLLGDMDKHMDNVVRFRSKMGAVYNRLEAAGERNEAQNLNLTEMLSKKADIDIAEKMMEYSIMSSIYEASLSSGAKIMKTSLLDYI
jgi:flagellar hook-associated protein 3 FlgL